MSTEEAEALARVQALYDEARAIEGRIEVARRQLADDQEYARQRAETALRFYTRDDVRVQVQRRYLGPSGGECMEWVEDSRHPAIEYLGRLT